MLLSSPQWANDEDDAAGLMVVRRINPSWFILEAMQTVFFQLTVKNGESMKLPSSFKKKYALIQLLMDPCRPFFASFPWSKQEVCLASEEFRLVYADYIVSRALRPTNSICNDGTYYRRLSKVCRSIC